jgi:hypothetical protein
MMNPPFVVTLKRVRQLQHQPGMRVGAASFLAVTASALIGCGSTPEPIQTDVPAGKATPDGALRHSIACSGAGWADCYEKAAAACPGQGYVVLGHENTGASAGASGQRTLVIECKDYSPR